MFKIDVGISRPDRSLQLFAGYEFSRTRNQGCQNLKWLLLQSNAQPALAQFRTSEIQLERAEPNDTAIAH
jgi:hypothetical protein